MNTIVKYIFLIFVITLFSCNKNTIEPKHDFILGKWKYSGFYQVPNRNLYNEVNLKDSYIIFGENGIVTFIDGKGDKYRGKYSITESTDTFFNYQLNIKYKTTIDYDENVTTKEYYNFKKIPVNFKHYKKNVYNLDVGNITVKNEELIVFDDLSERCFIKQD